MSATVIKPISICDLKVEESIINYLNKTGDFYVENPFFDKKVKSHEWLLQSSLKNDGTLYRTPRIMMKDSRGVYSTNYALKWVPEHNKPQAYFIGHPYEFKVPDYGSVRTSITPSEHTDDGIILLQHQLSMVLELLVVAKLHDIDLSKYESLTDNSDLYVALATDLDVDPIPAEYVKSFNEPPTWSQETMRLFDYVSPDNSMLRTRPCYLTEMCKDGQVRATNSVKINFNTESHKMKRPTIFQSSKDDKAALDIDSVRSLWGTNFNVFKGIIVFNLEYDTRVYQLSTMSVFCNILQFIGNISEYVAPIIEDDEVDYIF